MDYYDKNYKTRFTCSFNKSVLQHFFHILIAGMQGQSLQSIHLASLVSWMLACQYYIFKIKED